MTPPTPAATAARRDPVCLMCGKPYRAGASPARPKMTCSGGCKEWLRKVLAAPTQRDARRLICERRPNAPRGLYVALLLLGELRLLRRSLRLAVASQRVRRQRRR